MKASRLADYYQARDWLERFIPYTYTKSNLGLERIEYFLEKLGNPHEKFKSIHIAGTSGKGSCAFYLARGLEFAGPVSCFLPASAPQPFLSKVDNPNVGYKSKKGGVRAVGNPSMTATRKKFKVGLHISPHLVYIGERMQIFERDKESKRHRDTEVGGPISVERLVGLINEIKPVVEAIKRKQPHLTPSYFEILVAASFLYFAKEKVDVAVVEVGLGGRLDATNVLTPELSIITNVGLDHTDILGNSVEKIAKEKAGIIGGLDGKEGLEGTEGTKSTNMNGVVVTGASGKALQVIEKVAKEKKAPLITIGTLEASDRAYYDLLRGIKAHIDVVNGGKFQVIDECFFLVNLALNQLGIRLSENQQRKVFSAHFEGRFEEIDDGIIIDGAHNRDKVRALIKWVQKILESRVEGLGSRKINLVCGFKKGKDWKGMLRLLLDKLDIDRVYTTQYVTPTDTGFFSAVEPETIKSYIESKSHRAKVKVIGNSQEAVWEAVNERDKGYKGAGGARGLVLVTGSLYLAGEARTLWKLPVY